MRNFFDLEKLTALIITFNERKNLPEAIDTVAFADEIVVVDSFSTDGTFEFLKNDKRVKTVQHPFKNFAQQRNFALLQAVHDWVLFIDADERIPKKLQKEIQKTIHSKNPKTAYFFKRKFFFKGKPLRFSGLQSDKIHRLFQKSKARYKSESLVHEKLEVQGESGILKHKLLHYFYEDYDGYKQKMLTYGRLKAVELHRQKLRPNFYHFYIKPAYKFLNHFVLRLGFLDGKMGWTISYLNAKSVSERYRELKRLQGSASE